MPTRPPKFKMQNDFLTYQKGKIKYIMYIMHLLNIATCLKYTGTVN